MREVAELDLRDDRGGIESHMTTSQTVLARSQDRSDHQQTQLDVSTVSKKLDVSTRTDPELHCYSR